MTTRKLNNAEKKAMLKSYFDRIMSSDLDKIHVEIVRGTVQVPDEKMGIVVHELTGYERLTIEYCPQPRHAGGVERRRDE